jgi:cell division protease FtsH
VTVLASFLGYYDFKEWAGIWVGPLLMVVFLVVLVVALRQMRPTRPQQIKPEASPQIAWDEIAGVDEAKDELREVVEFLRDPKRFKRLGASVPKGILLHGPPGTGKTLLAKAVAHESRANFFAQSAAAFVETFVGVGAARIRRLFKVARKKAPAIVFIDELDAVGGRRGADISGEKDQTLNQLLVEMDGFTARGDVVVIAASNLLEKLDPALLRPGRFDRQIFVSPPDRVGRVGILHVHTRAMPLAPSVDLDLVARQTSGLTGADLASICNEAAIGAARPSRSARRTSTPRWSASSPACRPSAASTSARSGSSPTTRPATRCAPSCCRRSTASTASRSCRGAARSATRSTCPRRTAI